MRKSLCVAVCAITLVGAGPLAALESKTVAQISDPLSARIEQAVQLLRGSPAQAPKAQLSGADGGATGSRSLTRTQNAQPGATQEDERGSYVMALAGLMIMGVIIRRRYGKGD